MTTIGNPESIMTLKEVRRLCGQPERGPTGVDAQSMASISDAIEGRRPDAGPKELCWLI